MAEIFVSNLFNIFTYKYLLIFSLILDFFKKNISLQDRAHLKRDTGNR